MEEKVALGHLLRERRHALGWSTKQAAVLYGKLLRPIKAETIWKLEEGAVPDGMKRRLVLARIYALAPAVLGIPTLKRSEKIFLPPRTTTRSIDLQENKSILLRYWKEGYNDPKAAIRDLHSRTSLIQSRTLYTGGLERLDMSQTLCGYKMWLGHVLREQGYNKNALLHFNEAIVLAHEEELSVFEAAALLRRGEFFFDQGDFKNAEKDFEKALLIRPLPPPVEGRLKVMASLTKSHLAQTEKEKTEAWSRLKGVDSLARAMEEYPLYLLRMSIGGFHRYSARVFMGPPVKKLRDPNKAYENLEETKKQKEPKRPDLLRHYSYNQLDFTAVEAQIERDKGYYPLAVERAEEAVKMSREMHTIIHVPLLNSVYEDISASSYGKDTSVAELGLQLLFLQFPQIFH